MKTQQTKSISLKKLTIARINPNSMYQIKGGSSLPTITMGTKHTLEEECLIED